MNAKPAGIAACIAMRRLRASSSMTRLSGTNCQAASVRLREWCVAMSPVDILDHRPSPALSQKVPIKPRPPSRAAAIPPHIADQEHKMTDELGGLLANWSWNNNTQRDQ